MPDFSRDFSISHDGSRGSCTIRFRCFDTPNEVTLFGMGDPERAEALLLVVRAKCLEFHRIWSFSDQRSDIARLNGDALRVEVDGATADLLGAMKDFNRAEPLFDFTIGPLSFAWKHADRLPDGSEVERAMAHVGPDKVTVDESASPPAVLKAEREVRIDVGGAAKGYVADWVADFLRGSGVASADVDLGGNLFMVGSHPSGRPWRVAVRVPEGISADRTVLEARDCSIVTSGSYERFVEIGGKRYQHIVDPRTGWPSESDIVSATVVSPSSLEADMLATTTLLTGLGDLAALAGRHPSCRFVAITEDGRTLRYNGGHERLSG